MAIFTLILVTAYIGLSLLMCNQESKKRRISIISALLICLVTSPLFGYFIISSFPLRNPKGCKWCGNQANEAEYCGLCGKNEAGDLRPARKTV